MTVSFKEVVEAGTAEVTKFLQVLKQADIRKTEIEYAVQHAYPREGVVVTTAHMRAIRRELEKMGIVATPVTQHWFDVFHESKHLSDDDARKAAIGTHAGIAFVDNRGEAVAKVLAASVAHHTNTGTAKAVIQITPVVQAVAAGSVPEVTVQALYNSLQPSAVVVGRVFKALQESPDLFDALEASSGDQKELER